MRLKKWRSTHNQRIVVFVNDYLPDTNISIHGNPDDTWMITKGPHDRKPLTPDQISEIKEEVEEITGVGPDDGFVALCKEVEW
jgi:hypothetical protein